MVSFFPGFRKRRSGPSCPGGPFRVAIVGAGRFASRTYYPLLDSMRGVTVVAACARSTKRLAPLARRHRIGRVFTSIPEMIERSEPEAVIVVVPPAAALSAGRAVLEAGRPLFIEKPPGLSVVETRELAALAERLGLVSLVAFNRRYCAVVREAISRVREAGGVQSVLVEFHKDKPAGGAGDDLVTDIIHSVDLLRAIGGEVSEVVASSEARSASGLSSPALHALVRFAEGGTGMLAAFRSGGGRRERIGIHGAGISAEIDPPAEALISLAGSDAAERITARSLTGSGETLDTYGFRDEVVTFLESIRTGRRPPTDLADAVGTMELVERLRESARAKTLSPGKPPAVTRPAPPRPPRPAVERPRTVPTGERPDVLLLLHPEIGRLVLPASLREELSSFARVIEPDGEVRRREAGRLLSRADAVVTSWKSPKLREGMAGQATRLRIIAHAAGSVKTFVDPAFFERGVSVVNAAAAIAPSVGEMALALTLTALRSIPRYDRDVRGGGFRKESIVAPADSRGLFGRTVGLIGFGRTGREFARLLEPFGCEIVVFDPHADPSRLAGAGVRAVPLDTLLGHCDVVSLHCAYTPQTHHILNADRLSALKAGCLVVNTARGALIDETALAARLRTGEIGAALDVAVVEPLPAGSPLFSLPNVVLTPHIAGPTLDRLPELGRSAVEDLRLFFSGGTPKNLVTREMLATMA